MALALLPHPYPVHSAPAHFPRPYHPRALPRAMDQPNGSRISLPSISSLIEAANEASEAGLDRSPKDDHSRRVSGSPVHPQPEKSLPVGSPRNHLPPTPPLPPTSSFDFPRNSPGNSSPSSQSAPNSAYYTQLPGGSNPELYAQRHSVYPPIPDSAYPPIPEWSPLQPPHSPTEQSGSDAGIRAPASSYPDLPGDGPQGPQYSGIAHQRPLPGNFPPSLPVQPQQLPPIDPQMAPTWQHHHYFPHTATAPYAQTQERYICPTCNKPFSRPSSLKIHTYSHTGEKPYKCKHEGCGKYFSVRSNMKRHEKGCHGGESSSTGGNSPRTA